ncbi:MAG: hypothetical protein ACRD40_19060 [Candidatus Acidiferrales bacterium]
MGVGGTIGGVTGALVGLGIPEYEAKTYERRLRRGGILLSIHCETANEISRAKDLMKGTGAQHVAAAGESPSGSQNIEKRAARNHTLH